jgi:hypothetical protein
MKKIIRLTESQLIDVVKRVISEQYNDFGNFLDSTISGRTSGGFHIGLIPKGGNMYEFEGLKYITDLPIILTVNEIDDVYISSDGLKIRSGRTDYFIDRNKKLSSKTAW